MNRCAAEPRYLAVTLEFSTGEAFDYVVATESGDDCEVVHFWIDNEPCTAELRPAA